MSLRAPEVPRGLPFPVRLPAVCPLCAYAHGGISPLSVSAQGGGRLPQRPADTFPLRGFSYTAVLHSSEKVNLFFLFICIPST